MSCQNIESSITELARGQLLEARVKEETLAHIESCQRCASSFADQQTLSSGLRALRASVATTDVPARIEAGLLEAFRRGPSASRLVSRPKAGPRWLTWSIAAAAAVLIISALTIPQFLSSGPREVLVERASEKQPVRGTDSDEDDSISQP